MINLYIAKNNCGKTTLLYDKFDKLKNNDEKCIFFPVGNEILASINNDESKSNNIKYENPLYRVINDVIKSNIDPKDDQFEKLKLKYSSFLKKLIDKYSQISNSYEIINNKFDDMLKQNFDDNQLIQHNDFLPEFKVKKGDNNISTGEWQISNIFCSIKWLKLLKDDIKLYIFFDEPETYLHPQYIEILCSAIMDLNNTKNIDFYIATHNPQIIRNLINGVEKNKIDIYVRTTPYNNDSKPNNINDLFEKLENISTNQKYISANYILAKIFDVYTIEYFDELLGEIFNSHYDAYQMITGSTDEQYCQDNPDKIKGYCFETGKEFNVTENGRRYYHKTYMSFVRNYFHHPSLLYKRHLETTTLRIDNLLRESIKWLLKIKNNN